MSQDEPGDWQEGDLVKGVKLHPDPVGQSMFVDPGPVHRSVLDRQRPTHQPQLWKRNQASLDITRMWLKHAETIINHPQIINPWYKYQSSLKGWFVALFYPKLLGFSPPFTLKSSSQVAPALHGPLKCAVFVSPHWQTPALSITSVSTNTGDQISNGSKKH